jgi:hypothetical protein
MPDNPGSPTTHCRSNYKPDHTIASVARRMRSAERHIARWRTMFPELPREHRERLAALLLVEDPADPTGGQR